MGRQLSIGFLDVFAAWHAALRPCEGVHPLTFYRPLAVARDEA
jgi:hypothetical protein